MIAVRHRKEGIRDYRLGVVGQTVAALGILVILLVYPACRKEPAVVVYTSVDQPFSEPVLKEFQARSGIQVLPVYDVEASKTTGLVNRLVAERARPKADVFWSSEIAQTLWLKKKGILQSYFPDALQGIARAYRDPEGYWTPVGLRARVFLINSGLVSKRESPTSLFDLARLPLKPGEAGMANPLFGTSATQAAMLYAALGPDKASAYYRSLKEAGIQILEGNSVVRDAVATGALKLGVVDNDDAQAAVERGAAVSVIYPDDGGMGTLYIPNTVALISGAPNPARGRLLLDYLVSTEVEERLKRAGFFCASVRSPPDGFRVDWHAVGDNLDRAKNDCKDLFLK